MSSYIFSSESVSEGHPDKLCDQISDAILDAYLEKDKNSRVAVECFVKNNFLIIGGEISSKAKINKEEIKNIARKKIKSIGYDNLSLGFSDKCEILVNLSEQSPDIAQGVDYKKEKEQGAGDQGLMFGYACKETKNFMPLAIDLSHKIMQKISELRRSREINGLRPDAKCQVTVEYENGKPKRAHTIVLSSQHDEDIDYSKFKNELIEKVIKPICEDWIDNNTIYHINPTGKFVFGGPAADTGLTGRKIIVDSYGGYARHGGGCFSGKDPSKVDRSAAYAARYISKNIVAAGIADKCEIQIAYAIGLANPVSIYVECFGTNKIPENKIIELIKENFPLKPRQIIDQLNLARPIYNKTAVFGHFGRNDSDFTWEKLDKVNLLNQKSL